MRRKHKRHTRHIKHHRRHKKHHIRHHKVRHHHYGKRTVRMGRGKKTITMKITITPHHSKKADLRYKAMRPGRRISRSGRRYYEYRINRVDIHPKLRY